MIALAITEAGGDPRNAAGIDLVSLGKANIASNGKIGADIAEHCWGIIFLSAAGETVPAKCTEWLVQQQRQDGGWGESDKVLVQDTGLAIEALTATGEKTQDKLDAAIKLLRGRINSDGGFKGPSGRVRRADHIGGGAGDNGVGRGPVFREVVVPREQPAFIPEFAAGRRWAFPVLERGGVAAGGDNGYGRYGGGRRAVSAGYREQLFHNCG